MPNFRIKQIEDNVTLIASSFEPTTGSYIGLMLVEYENTQTIYSDDSFRIYVAILVVTASILGLITNIFIIAVSLWNIQGDYRHFIANLAGVDIVCCMNLYSLNCFLAIIFAFMGYVNLNDGHGFSTQLMIYSAFAFYGSFGVMISALIPISWSRIVAAARPQSYDKVAKYFFILYGTLTTFAYLITFLLNTLIFCIVAKHVPVVQCLHDRTRLLETRQVALATLAQAIVPLVCQVPAFLALSSTLFLVQPLIGSNVNFYSNI